MKRELTTHRYGLVKTLFLSVIQQLYTFYSYVWLVGHVSGDYRPLAFYLVRECAKFRDFNFAS